MSRLKHRARRLDDGLYAAPEDNVTPRRSCPLRVIPYRGRYATACIDAAKWFRALLGAHGLLLLLIF
jgi:hypothetical protein